MAYGDSQIVQLDRPGTDAMPWAQDVFGNENGKIKHLWLLGSAYNRSLIRVNEGLSPVYIRDYIGDWHLTEVGTPTISARSVNAGPNAGVADSGLITPHTLSELVQDANGTIATYAYNRLTITVSPANIANNDTITITPVGGAPAVITFKTSGAVQASYQVNIGTALSMLNAVAAILDAYPTVFGCRGEAFTVTGSTAFIDLWSLTEGPAQNAIAVAISLSCTTKTLLGATFNGGGDPAATYLAVLKAGANGDVCAGGFFSSAGNQRWGFTHWEDAPGATARGMVGYCVNAGQSNVPVVAGESGQEGTNWVCGILTTRKDLTRMWRMRSGAAPTFTDVSTGISLPVQATDYFRVLHPIGTSMLSVGGRKGDCPLEALGQGFGTLRDVTTWRADMNANLLTGLGMTV